MPSRAGWAALAIGLFSGCSSPPEPPSDAPNLVLVTLCSWRVDRIGAYGAPTSPTPHFDAFAQESVLFENAYANATFTDASHASMFTGLYPGHEGMLDFGNVINPEVHTLPEIVQLYNYQVRAFLDERSNLDRGGFNAMARGFGPAVPSPTDSIHSAVTAWAKPLQTPWLAWIHLRRAHVPYGVTGEDPSVAPEVLAWLQEQTPKKGGKKQIFRRKDDENDPNSLFLAALEKPEVRASLDQVYNSGLQNADLQLGEVLDGLRADGLLDRSIVVIVGDHGEALGEQGKLLHQGSLVEPVLHVPMLVHLPNGTPRRESSLVSLVDLLPTLTELSHLVTPAGLDGQSLVPLLNGQSMPTRPVLAQAMRLFGDDNHVTLRNALISMPYWYNADVDGEELWKQESGRWLRADEPDKQKELAAQVATLSRNSMWQSLRPALPQSVQEELRKNGYW